MMEYNAGDYPLLIREKKDPIWTAHEDSNCRLLLSSLHIMQSEKRDSNRRLMLKPQNLQLQMRRIVQGESVVAHPDRL
jgi:hypothetical protein